MDHKVKNQTKLRKQKNKKQQVAPAQSLLGHFFRSQARIKEEGWNCDIKKHESTEETDLGCFLLTFCLPHDVIPLSYSIHHNYMHMAN